MINYYGIIGFLGFEFLKIYKRIWSKKSLFPKKYVLVYIISIIGIGLFSGILSNLFAPDNVIEAIFIGFSVPTSIKTILEPKNQVNPTQDVIVDDIELKTEEIKLSFNSFYRLIFY